IGYIHSPERNNQSYRWRHWFCIAGNSPGIILQNNTGYFVKLSVDWFYFSKEKIFPVLLTVLVKLT
ncbi:MAG TPA: hypothetical protein VJY62_17555, partial [Bacteroidia bacterium]|nr:hypothetical protein [Bacteroidia bacterium]